MLIYKLLSLLEKTPLWIRIVLAVMWYGFIWRLTEWPQATPDNTMQVIAEAGAPEEANTIFRTSSHFFVFGVQSIFLLFMLDSSLKGNRRIVLLVLIMTVCLGILDEVHQGFVPGRQPRALDVLKDGIGATLFLWLIVWMKSIYTKRFEVAK